MDFTGQAATFLTTLVLGALLSVIFDFYRVLRGIFKPRSAITYVFDLLYWLLAIFLAFSVLLISNWGELRFYIFIGLAGGALLYFRLLSRYVLFALIRSIRLLLLTITWFKALAAKLLVQPVVYCAGLACRPFIYGAGRAAAVRRRLSGWLRARLRRPPNQDAPPK